MVRMRKLFKDETGAVTVMVGFSMILIVGFIALVVDLGMARQRSLQARNSADFAALAGAGVLKTGTAAQAEAAARDYVARNDFNGTAAEVNVPPTSGLRAGNAACVQVKPTDQIATAFGGIFNVDTMQIGSSAVACASPALGGPYAIFAGSTTCADAINFSGANRTINGGVHSNNDMKITGAGTSITGNVTYLNGAAPAGNITLSSTPRKLTSPLAYPETFAIEDYQPGGAKALLAQSQGRYFNAGSAQINSTWLTLNLLINPLTKSIAPGLYYTTGGMHLNGNGYNAAGATFVNGGTGDIQLNGNNFNFTPWDPDGLLLFSNKTQSSCNAGNAVIKLDGNTHSWTGIMYAPNGPLDFSGTNIVASLNGRLVANTVSLSGSSQTITRNDSYPGRTDGFELVE